jgi:4-hydroxy-3-polyprenylbenzoate decarboxylase
MEARKLIIGISGASAPTLGIRALELLKTVPEVETHLVITRAGKVTIALETDYSIREVEALADVCYKTDDIAAPISSGSFKTSGMIVAPCSVNTMSCIAASISKDLLTRAADVTLKERRPLVLMIRESPLHVAHLRRMVELAELGVTIAPPTISLYHDPQGVMDLVDHALGRALDIFDLELPWLRRWEGPQAREKSAQGSKPREEDSDHSTGSTRQVTDG